MYYSYIQGLPISNGEAVILQPNTGPPNTGQNTVTFTNIQWGGCSLYLSQSAKMGVKEGPELLREVLNWPKEQFKFDFMIIE